ncbi:MAG: hypothetical protein RLZZ316_2054 [Bacteroidota bacterium]|jgi:hypothetical protein
MTIFTPEDLIQFAYKETSQLQTSAIQQAIASDWNLSEELESIQEVMQQLDGELFSPRQQSVTRVLNYARKTVVV